MYGQEYVYERNFLKNKNLKTTVIFFGKIRGAS